MDLSQKTKNLCQYYNLKPARARGQNFLISESVFDRVVELADLKKDDVVLEVGPGLGFLTTKLAKRVKRVIAVELDDKLAEVLTAMVKQAGIDNIEIRNKSALDIDISGELPPNYKIVANLPYQITSKFLRIFLESANQPQTMTLMLQKEVAERIVAQPGQMSLLALSVQFYAEAELKDIVQRHNFWPEPEVDSALIQISINKETPPVPPRRSAALPLRGGELKKQSGRGLPGTNKETPPVPPRRSAALPLRGGELKKQSGRGLPSRGKPSQASAEKSLPLPRGRSGGGFRPGFEKEYFRLAKIGFSSKRKMLKNNLAAGLQLPVKEVEEKLLNLGFKPTVRAQELNITDWAKLLGVFRENML